MKTSTICPCCSRPMLYHIGQERDYWFCPSCRQPMPNLVAASHSHCIRSKQIVNLSPRLDQWIESALV